MEGQLDKTRNRPWYRRKRLFGVVAALAFLVYSFWGTDPKAIWDAFSHMRPLYLIPVLLGIIGMPLVRALRLKYILDLEQQVGQWRLFAIYNVGQMLNQMLPALTGQVGRVVLFSRTLGVTKTFAFTMVMLEVLFDGITLIMLIFSASSLFVLPDWMESDVRTVVLTRDLASMLVLASDGLLAGEDVNLGGLHARKGREEVLPYLFLDQNDRETLEALTAEGVTITAQNLPGAPKVRLGSLLA